MGRGADVTGNAWSFGEECLCFRDPDGLELALIEEATETGSNDQDREEPADRVIRRIRSVEIQIEGFQPIGHLTDVEVSRAAALRHEQPFGRICE
jgi:hypothetical protein